ncbi:RNA polymerase II C-terminal domain phosphatase-like 3 [Typha angustifolia]|uniref:RNA polymerase II C-terminal domain phosphatase-like 3 n=1 Tax=Typha angustifolia TaxID=59011 RepID=UPI003C2DBB9E
MRLAGSNRFFLDPREEETLERMAKERSDEKYSSDGDSSASLEEISADDFKRPPRSSVCMEYTNLYSFSWAQAMQNKPLDLDLMPMSSADESKPAKMESCEVIIDDSSEESTSGMGKEEGELEEGEIEFVSELPPCETIVIDLDSPEKESVENESDYKIGGIERHASLVSEELENVTVEEAEASFEAACSRLLKSFESLKTMSMEVTKPVPMFNNIIQQLFGGIQTANSVLSSGNLPRRDENKEFLLRLLIDIKNQYSHLLIPDQVKELDATVQSLVFDVGKEISKPYVGSGIAMNDVNLVEKPAISSHDLVSLEKPLSDTRAVNSLDNNGPNDGLPNLQLPNFSRSRVVSPLLDLHMDYDESSLPSPTREKQPPLPIPKPITLEGGASVSTQPITSWSSGGEDTTTHLYVTDVLKVFSSYQQKYGRNSFDSSNRLPSPTPSQESNDDDDPQGEVSSSSVARKAAPKIMSSPMQIVRSSSDSVFADSLTQCQGGPATSLGHFGVKPAAKSRDPRLRFVNSEMGGSLYQNQHTVSGELIAPCTVTNSRKHKADDEFLPGGTNLKKQRNGVINSRDMQMTSGRGGWLEDISSVASYPGDRIQLNKVDIGKVGVDAVCSNKQLSSNTNFSGASSGAAPPVSLPSLLWGMAVNPTMLAQLIQKEQKRLQVEAQKKIAASTVDATSTTGVNIAAGAVLSASGTSMYSSEVRQNQAGRPQMQAEAGALNLRNDVGTIQMKPRDPRRILHCNIVQKNDLGDPQQPKPNGTLSSVNQVKKDQLIVRENGEQAQTSSQSTAALPMAPQNISLRNSNSIKGVDVRPDAAELYDSKIASGVDPGRVRGALLSTNPWGEVDHLLGGYDDQQKAAILRERARRIAEQNKMFSAKKLCLVLDLDHTLLNSAKFIEVDPVHEEILRKKEELDRGKSQRHLFCFRHLGMWTKLRPGVWDFLEKASKLYELHLYTMGNKLYATEMAKVLDPTGTLFAGRVISRGDEYDSPDGEERVPKSKDLDGVLGMESAVVIIDDSVKVWPHNKLNLIAVERYIYFPCSRRHFGLSGPSLLEIDHDERPEDGTLASSLVVIERVHRNFFSHISVNDVDVRNILAAEQRKILAGCRIVFSRIFPVEEANPQLHPLWQMAQQFGASCTNQIDEHVTHVVANSLGTNKVNWALSTGRFVVHPGWVEASAFLYRRANEYDFVVKP